MEGGKIDEGDQAQVAEGFHCRDALDLIVFFFVGPGETLKVLHRE